jgi:hypothetical protein
METQRKWLLASEASYLGLTPKPAEKGRKQRRYNITEEQWEEIQLKRLEDKEGTVRGTTTLYKDGVEVMQWVKRNKTQDDILNALRASVMALKEKVEPTKPIKVKKANRNANLCNQYTLTDYHLGMMAWGEETGDDWDIKIAEDTLVKFFEVSIKESPNAEQAIFAQLGDFLHWDGLDAVTPQSKHLLDADTRFTKLVRVAIRVIRRIIKMLLKKYKSVHVIMAEGNHDTASSIWLREMLSSFYDKEPRLTIETSPDPYYCYEFGKNCLFYHHGHKRNIKNIDTVFIGKFKKQFGLAEYVYGHVGHLHHSQKESNLMILEQHRTLAAKDAYASRGGYLSGRDSVVITYHKDYGEVSRSTININRLK